MASTNSPLARATAPTTLTLDINSSPSPSASSSSSSSSFPHLHRPHPHPHHPPPPPHPHPHPPHPHPHPPHPPHPPLPVGDDADDSESNAVLLASALAATQLDESRKATYAHFSPDSDREYVELLPQNLEGVVQVEGYRVSYFLYFLALVLIIGSGGIVGLVLLWVPRARVWFLWKCDLGSADYIVYQKKKKRHLLQVETSGHHSFFVYKCIRHIYDPIYDCFLRQPEQTAGRTISSLLKAPGLAATPSPLMSALHGPNVIHVPMPNIVSTILEEILAPTYVYQYLCVALWIHNDYEVFGVLILIAVWLEAAYDLYLRRKAKLRMRKLAAYTVPVEVLRDDRLSLISSSELLPGDVIRLSNDEFVCPCDFFLLSGTAVVDESSLTGESLPAVKVASKPNTMIYNPDKHSKQSLYSGTTVMRVTPSHGQDDVFALVTRTGFFTTKGKLVRQILHPSKVVYKYEKEARRFLLVLIFVAVILFLLTLSIWGVFDGRTKFDIKYVLLSCEIVAIIIPPMLPLVFKLGLTIATKELRSLLVSSKSPDRIPLAGSINTFCFDKTGTLTRSDLDAIGVVPVTDGCFNDRLLVPSELATAPPLLRRSLACCHSLSVLHVTDVAIDVALSKPVPEVYTDYPEMQLAHTSSDDDDDDTDGPHRSKPGSGRTYTGPMLDRKMFEMTNADLFDHEEDVERGDHILTRDGHLLLLLKRFDFDHDLQRMSAIVENGEGDYEVYIKGAIEKVVSCCSPSSLPKNWEEEAARFSRQGCYVIAIATKKLACLPPGLKEGTLQRKEIERDLDFAGLLVFRNELKEDTAEAIASLKRADIYPVMITGDNVYTAAHIASHCHILEGDATVYIGDYQHKTLSLTLFTDPTQSLSLNSYDDWDDSVKLCVTASAFEFLIEQERLDVLFDRCVVLARMKPLQKEKMVRLFKERGDIVGMSGDGANDCAALSAAHCGIALSEADAALSSPFTGLSLSCVSSVDLVRTGRSSLVTSFSAFKFTIFYGFFQSLQVMLMYCYGTDFSDWQYVFIDFMSFTPLIVWMVKSRPVSKLSGPPPTNRVFGPSTLSSIIFFLFIAFANLAVIVVLLDHSPLTHGWYKPTHINNFEIQHSTYENATFFIAGNFLYIGAAIAYTWGGVWRKHLYKNVGFFVTACALLVLSNTYALFEHTWDPLGVSQLLRMVEMPILWRLTLVGISFFTVVLMVSFETLVSLRYCSRFE